MTTTADRAGASDPDAAVPVSAAAPSVAVVTLGCARNEVDSDELAGRLAGGGFRLVADPARADTVLVNTCGFIEAAKKDSVDALLEAADLKHEGGTRAVVAVGCLAERYGAELADALPEADAVLGFDDYPDIAARLRDVLDGRPAAAHTPRDRRLLLPIAPVDRAGTDLALPGHGGTGPVRHRLDTGPTAAAQAGLGLRPAVHLLRHPELPRLLRQPATAGRAGRGPLAGRGGRARALPGQRELDVLRQGPR